MDPLFLLHPPDAPPDPPRRWSFSTLSVWRSCPRRWWLANARYPNVIGEGYPERVAAAAVKGRVMHKAVEVWLRGEPKFVPRQFIKTTLRSALLELRGNPRVDVGRLEAMISIDECVDKFFALTRDMVPPGSAAARGTHQPPSDAPPSKAAEYWVEVEDPPLCGKIDRVLDDRLIDFKTGEPDPHSHAQQLRFYAILWVLRFDRLPGGLEVRYAETDDLLDVPDRSSLLEEAHQIGEEVAEANRLIPLGQPNANPSAEGCRYCPVRQLCGEYWVSPATAGLRLPAGTGEPNTVAELLDVHVSNLPVRWLPGAGCRGRAMAEGLGEVELDVPDNRCPASAEAVTTLRLLGAIVTVRPGRMLVRVGQLTEAFWGCARSASCRSGERK